LEVIVSCDLRNGLDENVVVVEVAVCLEQVLVEPRDRGHGGRDYVCRDLEGHVWTFGTYDPWASTGG
jgi:uncharacterized glyoxalase superfamily protein PhnB